MGSLGIIAVREMTMTWSRKVLKKGSDNANLCVCVCKDQREDERTVPQALRDSNLLHHGTSPI